MYMTNLRKVGGSVMLAVPPSLLELLQMKAGSPVGVAVDAGRLIIEPAPKPRYTADELLAASDYSGQFSPEDREWIDTTPTGKELL
jgi:antitoxin ChpS